MLGIWSGNYKFDDRHLQRLLGHDRTYFRIDIQSFDGKHFTGIVNDDVATGGMEETGKITGTLKNKEVRFKKQMPVESYLGESGSIKNNNRKHPTLYYQGNLSANNNFIIGQWKFKRRIGFLYGFIPFPFRPGKGTWRMTLNDVQVERL